MYIPPNIAVVGIDGIFPGASDLERFWQNILEGRVQSAPVPQHRWIAPVEDRLRDTLEPDRTYSRHACLIDDFQFDPSAFRLDPDLTRHLDPVHQLTLTAGRRAVNSVVSDCVDPTRVDTILATIALPTDGASTFSRSIMGTAIERHLFAGADIPAVRLDTAQAMASRVDGLPAALLAAEMGFGGDSFTLDAACSSSIYAIKLACDALNAHRAEMVVTGGVSRPECLYTQTGFSQLGALSPSGRCAPFDHQADGLVVGEGVGILVLKRLDDALAHGDVIHGVIRGIGLSNDMRGNLLAPESRGQVRAMRHAYRAAGWLPSDVDFIECHGTGTRAGDTTEIESLVELWQQWPVTGKCALGSIKSMIGHLLTAAGAAGLIKTLLAMRQGTLPPSANYTAAPADSPLEKSCFYVQTAPADWPRRESDIPRRAAVSAFGFGGINAHLLVEEWDTDASTDAAGAPPPITVSEKRHPVSAEPVAIVGMDLVAGGTKNMAAFTRSLFRGDSLVGRRPKKRWKGADAIIQSALDEKQPNGAYMGDIAIGIGEFKIPPNEIDAILPQQLLALKVGAGALRDAGMPLRQSRERMGVVCGIGFDFEATNFHLRWQLPAAMQRWRQQYGLDPGAAGADDLLERLREQCGPPLTPPRVLGALGGIVASRVAREFRFGGPSFVVSADAASGIKALQVAVDLLQSGDVDAMLVGAVDLAGDGRGVIRQDRLMPLSPTNTMRPLDARADGCLPGDGAVALVLKRMDRAMQDEDRIYAVLRGIGAAGGEHPDSGAVAEDIYGRSLARGFEQAGIEAASVSYIDTDGSAVPERDLVELKVLGSCFGSKGRHDAAEAIALGTTSAFCGRTGAAHGLMAVAKTALCLHHRILPPLPGFRRLPDALTTPLPFHLPHRSQPWYRNRQDGPRTACVATTTVDGGCSHVLLEESQSEKLPVTRFGGSPSYADGHGRLLVIGGDSRNDLDAQLAELKTHFQENLEAGEAGAAMDRWMHGHLPDTVRSLAIALIVEPGQHPNEVIDQARRIVRSDTDGPLSKKVFFQPKPMGAGARIAMIYPGSGNHYLGMGRDLALRFPDVADRMDKDTARLKTQWRPWHLMPWRQNWEPGWQTDAAMELSADPLNMIFGQVVFGGLMTGILDQFAIRPNGIIGYSLGESAALFAHGIWADRGEMLARMEATDLFTRQLAGPCESLRRAWNIDSGKPAEWRVAVVNRPAGQVRKVLKTIAGTRLLIVNTPDECVIGGLAPAVKNAIAALGCQAVYLDGVVTVHCDAARPVAEAYRQLHHFATTPKKELAVYSCSWASAYSVTSEKIADSIKKQAVDGFNFTHTIKQAHTDGYRVFIEAGPRASCTRMIGRILENEPHLAVSASHGSGNEVDSLLRCLAQLTAERVPLDLSVLYEQGDHAAAVIIDSTQTVHVNVGGTALTPVLPQMSRDASTPADSVMVEPPVTRDRSPATRRTDVPPVMQPAMQMDRLLDAARENIDATADAHRQFLTLSQELTQAYADTFDLQNTLLKQGARPAAESAPHAPTKARAPKPTSQSLPTSPYKSTAPAFDRRMCMEFAIGSVGRMLGPAFEVVDTHRVRVRLPDEPLMLVDRILSVDGEMLSMTS
ncbi:MAG: type I polyketide synthase, partial [Proteobacteria bacterium]